MPGARWDRRELRRITFEQRMEIERRLAKGESGLSITRSMDLRGPMVVSAVKKNPWPGGVRDRKAALASYEGDWIDERGVVRPFVGLKDGKVVYAKPVPGAHAPRLRPAADKLAKVNAARIEEKRKKQEEKDRRHELIARAHQEKKKHKEDPPETFKAHRGVRARVMPVPGMIASIANVEGDPVEAVTPDPAAGLETPPTPDTGKGGPPLGQTEEEASRGDDLGEVIPERERTRGNIIKDPIENTVAKARRLSRRALPLKERIEILAEMARGYKDDPRVAKSAIDTLNELDGLMAAAKAPAGAGLGTGPLFQLPRDMSIGFAPVGEQEADAEDGAPIEPPEVEIPALQEAATIEAPEDPAADPTTDPTTTNTTD